MAKDKLSLALWIEDAEKKGISLGQTLIIYNAEKMGIAADDLLKKMTDMLYVMKGSIDYGLTGVQSRSKLTGGSAKKMSEARQKENYHNILGPTVSDAVIFSLAVAEANAAMGRIVAAPTAGASGVLPGMLFALQKNYGLHERDMASGLVVAGSIGLVIANRSSLSGAMGGCQAETGSAAAMAAGAAVDMLGGTPAQVGHAVAITMKNMLGLVCDPVAGLVEVPCIKRNAGAVVQALTSAEMALSGISSFIPADEAIDAMKEVGDRMPCALKETAGGGLANVPTALAWAEEYFKVERQ
ncbi:MAG: L-serine ammonia-lyase, iron-sulfur-dependent, subunit alpha [Acidaminococcaceae bacterium]